MCSLPTDEPKSDDANDLVRNEVLLGLLQQKGGHPEDARDSFKLARTLSTGATDPDIRAVQTDMDMIDK
jgi:hypothetical protein